MSVKRIFYLFRIIFFANSLVFFAPVAILVRTQYGITVSEFFILQAILSIAIFIFEIPCGVITDKIGYKNSLIISQIVICIARAIFLIGGDFSVFVLQAVLEALCYAFSSGTFNAYIYDSDKINYEKNYAHLGNYATLGFISSTLLFFPLNHYFNINALVLATLIFSLLTLIVLFFIPNIKNEKVNKSVDAPKQSQWFLWLKVLKQPKFMLIMSISSLLSIGGFVVIFFYVLKLQAVNIDSGFMTVVILGYSAVKLLTPYFISKTENYSDRIFLSSSMFIIGIVFLMIAVMGGYFSLIPMIILPLMLSLPSIRLSKISNEMVDQMKLDEHRATFLSIISQVTNFFEVIFLFTASLFVDYHISVIFILTAILFLFSSLIFIKKQV